MTKYFLSFDAGTSGGKATVIDEFGSIEGFSKTFWNDKYVISPDLEPYGHEFSPDLFWSILIQDAKNAIHTAHIDPQEIAAITATSQRHGCVFLDKNGKELYAGPNRDARGLEVELEEYMENKELYEITGHGLPFLFALTRLLWFRENEEEIYESINHFLDIAGWVIFKLTDKYIIDETAAAETLFYDIKKKQWSEKIISEFKVDYEILPEIMNFGAMIGNIKTDAASTLGVKNNTPVIMSAADTQASMIGCGAITSGSLGVVAGSTMPVQLIIDKPIIDFNQEIWTGNYVNNLWVIESNAGAAGDIHQWFIDSILRKLDVKNPYDVFETLVLSEPPGSRGVYADLGPQIFDAQNMLLIPSGGGYSFVPIAYSFDTPVNISSFARALIENLAYAVRANAEKIGDLTNLPFNNIYLVGGLSRSKSFGQILANVMEHEVYTFIPEGASLAGAIACMVGIEKFKNTYEAVKGIITDYTIFYPQEDQSKEYESMYPNWREMYEKSRTEN